jgi:hypothetical protein
MLSGCKLNCQVALFLLETSHFRILLSVSELNLLDTYIHTLWSLNVSLKGFFVSSFHVSLTSIHSAILCRLHLSISALTACIALHNI